MTRICWPSIIDGAKATTAAIAVAAKRSLCISKVPPSPTLFVLVGGFEAFGRQSWSLVPAGGTSGAGRLDVRGFASPRGAPG